MTKGFDLRDMGPVRMMRDWDTEVWATDVATVRLGRRRVLEERGRIAEHRRLATFRRALEGLGMAAEAFSTVVAEAFNKASMSFAELAEVLTGLMAALLREVMDARGCSLDSARFAVYRALQAAAVEAMNAADHGEAAERAVLP